MTKYVENEAGPNGKLKVKYWDNPEFIERFAKNWPKAVEQFLRDHPNISREEAMQMFKESGLL